MTIKYYKVKEDKRYVKKGQVIAVYDNNFYHKLSTPTEGFSKSLFSLERSYVHFGGKENLEEVEDLDELIYLIPHLHKQFKEKYKQSIKP